MSCAHIKTIMLRYTETVYDLQGNSTDTPRPAEAAYKDAPKHYFRCAH